MEISARIHSMQRARKALKSLSDLPIRSQLIGRMTLYSSSTVLRTNFSAFFASLQCWVGDQLTNRARNKAEVFLTLWRGPRVTSGFRLREKCTTLLFLVVFVIAAWCVPFALRSLRSCLFQFGRDIIPMLTKCNVLLLMLIVFVWLSLKI